MARAYIGLDLGTTGIKAVAFDGDDNQLALAEVPTPLRTVEAGGEYDANELWDAATSVLNLVTAELAAAGHAPVAIAVASMGESGVLVNEAGEPLAPVIAWFDDRTEAQSQWWVDNVGIERTQRISGLTPKAAFGANKMRWISDNLPDAWAKGSRWLNLADWAAYRLSEVMATDYSLASRTMLLDVAHRQWSTELLSAGQIDVNLLAPLVQSGALIGTVTADAAASTGLPVGAVVGAGGQDHVCAALALGVTEPGTVLDSIGTAEALLLVTEGFDATGLISGAGVSQGVHVEPGRTYAMTGHLGGGRIDQRRQELGLEWDEFLSTHEANTAIDELAQYGQERLDVMLSAAGVIGTRQLITGGGSRFTRLVERKRDLSEHRVSVASQMQATALGAAKLARRAVESQ
jgi:xylulokinase